MSEAIEIVRNVMVWYVQHHRGLSAEELRRQVEDIVRKPKLVTQAYRELRGSGQIHATVRNTVSPGPSKLQKQRGG